MAQSNGDERIKLLTDMSELLHRHFQAQRRAGIEGFANAQGELIDYILADRKQHELEARIDEVNWLRKHWQDYMLKEDETLFDDHIAELKSERERLGK